MKRETKLVLFECVKCGHESYHISMKKKSNPTYSTYNGMKTRCLNKNVPSYKNYGGRGIKICDRWLESFDNFYNDMGNQPKSYTLDRINNDGNYSPENCKWVSRSEQNNNTSQVRYFKFNGLRLTTRQWSDKTGIPKTAIDARIKQGWTLQKILTTPSIKGRNQYGTGGLPITFNGKTMSIKGWSKKIGISYATLVKRINKYKWPLKRALTEKVK